MACAGVDFGNKNSVVAIARRGGIDICVNDVSNRATPSLVSFQGDERHIGEGAASIAAQNHRNTVSNIQRLLGITYTNSFAKSESVRLTCPTVPHPVTGMTAVTVNYSAVDPDDADKSMTTFSLEEVTAMLFSNLMATASNEYKAPVRDLVISVPAYYTDAQRRAVLNAARIANINILRILNEHAAIALSYGIFRTKELPESDPIKVAFVDIGEASTCVSISTFTNSRCDVISVASDPCLGGRDLDDILVNKFSKHFLATYKIDVLSKPKPAARLRKECEKVKRVLSTNPEVHLNIECLMDDIDVKGHITRDELVELAQPLLLKLRAVCEKAIAGAKLLADEKLSAVEIVGGSTRVPIFKSTVGEAFASVNAPIRTTLNADESIARGCALMCAMLSPAFKVRNYAVNDIMTDELMLDKVFTSGAPTETHTIVPKGNTIPCTKMMKFSSHGPLTISMRYKDVSSLPAATDHPHVCSYVVGAPVDPEAKVHARVCMSGSGVVELTKAQLVKEVEVEEEVEVPQEALRIDSSTVEPNGTPKEDAEMKDAAPTSTLDEQVPPAPKGPGSSAQPKDTPDTAAASTASSDKDSINAAKPPAPVVKEKRLVKKKNVSDLVLTALPDVISGMSEELVLAATEREGKMKAHDLYIKERSEALNALEAYVYDMRSRIDEYSGDLKEYSTSEFRGGFLKELNDTEEWIYSDEAESASKSVFVKRRETLMKKASDLLWRKREDEERPVRIKVLESSLENYKKVLAPNAVEYDHLSDEEKQSVQKCVETAALWLKDMREKQRTLSKEQDPIFTCNMLMEKQNEVDKVCDPVLKKPKPTPPKVEEDKKDEGEKNVREGEQVDGDAPMGGGTNDHANGENMDTGKDSGNVEMKD